MNVPPREVVIEIVAAELRAARAYRNLSQIELAEKSGLSRSTICRLEAGERAPSVPQLMALCEALDVSFEKILRSF